MSLHTVYIFFAFQRLLLTNNLLFVKILQKWHFPLFFPKIAIAVNKHVGITYKLRSSKSACMIAYIICFNHWVLIEKKLQHSIKNTTKNTFVLIFWQFLHYCIWYTHKFWVSRYIYECWISSYPNAFGCIITVPQYHHHFVTINLLEQLFLRINC